MLRGKRLPIPPGVCEGVREGKIYAMGFEGLIRSQKEKVEHISNIGISVHKGIENVTELHILGPSEKLIHCSSSHIMDIRVVRGKQSQGCRLELNFISCECFSSLSHANYGITKKFNQNCDLLF